MKSLSLCVHMKIIESIHRRLGDMWWYTVLQFVAARCGDFINAFIGLWLVPKYVGLNELGAVLPLAGFATFLAFPVSVFSTALSKQVNVLSIHGEWGRLKTMLRGVFLVAGLSLVVLIIVVPLILPHVLERVRVASGLLGVVIIASALVGTVAPIYQNSLQAMKRFKTVTWISLFCAPIRLVTMLCAMPFRALTGYFVGQASAPTFQILASLFSLRKELSTAVKPEPFWTKEVCVSFLSYMAKISLSLSVVSLVGFIEPLIIRQRLPEIDSAAYYMISRFAEIGSYLGLTLSTIVFPYVSEESEIGMSGNRLIMKAMLGAVAFGLLCAAGFSVVGRWAFGFLPGGENYAQYVPELVALTVILALNVAVLCFTSGETAANRFVWLKWFMPVNLFYVFFLFLATGYGYLRGVLPDTWVESIAGWNACRLRFILWTMGVFAVVKFLCCIGQLILRRQ